MPKLLWVKGPHTTDPERAVQIQWSMGNTCNFSCEYCPSILHNGTKPWLPTDQYLKVVDKISNHYRSKNRFMHWELLGGEVTTIPDFEKIIERIAMYNSSVTVYTNGSRTIDWWKEAREYLTGVVITYHPLTMDVQHLYDVVDVLKDNLILDINIAGIGGQVEQLSDVVNNLRNMFLDSEMQSVYDVNITIKTMYKKYLGEDNNHHKQETYYNYTPQEIKIMQRPGLLPNPNQHNEYDDPNDVQDHPRFWSTEFMYEDAPPKYVQSHQIINEGLNRFKGMKCELGFDSLNIDMNGEVISSWCGAKNFGNITQLDNWDIPKTETRCPFEFCNNLNDISITKTL
jgi:organic radical activating enzyme